MQWVSRSSRRPYRWAIGSLIGVTGPREIVAGVPPAHRNGKSAMLTRDLAHDVSILPGGGRHLGSQPRAKTSITIMRAAAVRAWAAQHTRVRLLLRFDGRRVSPEQCAGRRDALGAVGAGEEP